MTDRTALQRALRFVLPALLVLGSAAPVLAQQSSPSGPGQGMRQFGGGFGMREETSRILPFGPWWKDQDLVQRLELTPEQKKRIDDTFQQNRVLLVRLHSNLDNEQLHLQPLLDANPIDQVKALAEISKIADMRAELFKANARMLLQIRGVLTQTQWTRLQQERPSNERHHMYGRQPQATPSGVPPPPPPQ